MMTLPSKTKRPSSGFNIKPHGNLENSESQVYCLWTPEEREKLLSSISLLIVMRAGVALLESNLVLKLSLKCPVLQQFFYGFFQREDLYKYLSVSQTV